MNYKPIAHLFFHPSSFIIHSSMKLIEDIAAAVSPERGLTERLARSMAEISGEDILALFPITRSLRTAASGRQVFLCSIVNAKSGRCPEDCRFCAQSAHYRTGVKEYPLLATTAMAGAAQEAKASGAREFALVTSGKGVTNADEIGAMAEGIKAIAGLGLHPCVSPGIVSQDALRLWQAAGLTRYHHNLETAPSFFPEVCTTHGIEEDVAAVKAAKAAGLPVCCGGIFGMGESWAQRVELALLLRDLKVDSVPLNFLNPIPGTPLAGTAPGIAPLMALKTIALFRLVMPRARLIVCGGREVNLRDLQALMFAAGANGLMIGNYLTTPGRPAAADRLLLSDLGLEPAP